VSGGHRSVRRAVPWAGALAFALWELVAVRRWVVGAGGVGAAVAETWARLRSDWFLLIVVTDHLVIAGAVLLWVWADARRRGWPVAGRLAWVAAFIGLGTPALLGYVAERGGPERAGEER
jgi:hypothetical protein